MILHVPITLWQKIQYYVDAVLPREVTGIGTIEQVDLTNLKVTDIFLPEQHTSAGFSQFDDGALNNIIFDLIEYNPTSVGLLRFRWHSHGNGQVFWSGLDEADINSWEGPYVVNLVTNQHRDILARLDLFEPFRIANIPLDVIIDYPADDKLRAECYLEAQQKVKVQLLPEAKNLSIPDMADLQRKLGQSGLGLRETH